MARRVIGYVLEYLNHDWRQRYSGRTTQIIRRVLCTTARPSPCPWGTRPAQVSRGRGGRRPSRGSGRGSSWWSWPFPGGTETAGWKLARIWSFCYPKWYLEPRSHSPCRSRAQGLLGPAFGRLLGEPPYYLRRSIFWIPSRLPFGDFRDGIPGSAPPRGFPGSRVSAPHPVASGVPRT